MSGDERERGGGVRVRSKLSSYIYYGIMIIIIKYNARELRSVPLYARVGG